MSYRRRPCLALSDNDNEIAQRIRLVRKLSGLDQQQFAKRIGIPYKSWNHYETGYPMRREVLVTLLRHVEGLSVDWLWFGRTGNMPAGLLKQLQQLERQEREERRKAERAASRQILIDTLPKVRRYGPTIKVTMGRRK